MRKAKLYQLLAVAGGLSVAVVSTPALAGKGSCGVTGSLTNKSSLKYNTGTVAATVSNGTGQPQTVTLVTYKEYYGHTNYADKYDSNGNLIKRGQTVFDFQTIEVPAGTDQLEVAMPGCATQIDLVCGDVITYLGDELYGNRKMDYLHTHENHGSGDVWCTDETTPAGGGTSEPVAQCTVDMTEVTGISEGVVIEAGTILNIGADVTGGPEKVRFEITGPDGADIKSLHDEGQNPYYYLGDSNGGTPNGWDTAGLPEGTYTVTVSAYDRLGWNKNPKESCVSDSDLYHKGPVASIAQCDVSLTEITGISDDQVIEPGTTLNIGANVEGSPERVRFEVNGPSDADIKSLHEEGKSPYYYLGDANGGTPNGWNTTGLPDGEYSVTVSVYDNDGWSANPKTSCDSKLVTFTMEVPPVDSDGDGVPDDADNCPAIANPEQEDADDDEMGDVCDNNDSSGSGILGDGDTNGGPNMVCSEIMASNNASMSLIDKFEWSGNGYTHESGTNAIDINGDATGGDWAVNQNEIVDVDAVIIKGATGTYIYNYEPGAKISDVFSKLDLPLNNGGQVPDISNIQFCQDGVFDSKDAEVCLWSANKDADGSYINIKQVGCVGAEQGKFYAIEAGGEFSNALEAE